MNITCVAVDDEPLALQLVSQYASQLPFLQVKGCFEDALSASEFIKSAKPDLLLLDINMPDLTGLDLLASLPEPPMVVFTTAYKQHAYEGFELNAVDYLLKPFTFARFERAIAKVIAQKTYLQQANEKPQEGPAISVYSSYKLIRIALDRITYMEAMEDYIKIFLIDERPVITLMSLKKMMEKLPEGHFMRVHRSFIVSVDKIQYLRHQKVSIAGHEIQVSTRYLSALRTKLMK